MPRIYSRSELGMRPPRSVSSNFSPSDGGVAYHHGGGGPNPAPTTFEVCKRIWLSWQNFHMDGRGWKDIAYGFGICANGDIFTGRGASVRQGAQGTNYGNENFVAIVYLGGGGAPLTEKAKASFLWLTNYLRTQKKVGKQVKPHSAFVRTTCPDKALTALASAWNNKTITIPGAEGPVSSKPRPAFPLPSGHWFGIDDGTPYSHSGKLTRGRDDYWVRRIQKIVGTTVDGDYGPKTARAVKAWVDKRNAASVRLGDRTKVGPKIWAKMFV